MTPRTVSVESVEKAYRSAFMRGDAASSHYARTDVSFGCDSPVLRTLSRPDLVSRVTGRRLPAMGVAVRCECRRCADCLRRRASRWAERARKELLLWPRSYLVTMTLSPEAQAFATMQVDEVMRAEGIEPGSIDPADILTAKIACIGCDITRYFKRLRKRGLRFRYLVVAEVHKSGLPHFHAFVHEVERYTSDAWDTAKMLKGEWQLGFADIEGVDRNDAKAARYLCKYLSKSMLARVRPSIAYGRMRTDFRGPKRLRASHEVRAGTEVSAPQLSST